jgi:hypothetical protein
VNTSGAAMPGSNPLNAALELARRALRNAAAPKVEQPKLTAEEAAALGIPAK